MEMFLLYSYLKYRKENQGGAIKKFLKLPLFAIVILNPFSIKWCCKYYLRIYISKQLYNLYSVAF